MPRSHVDFGSSDRAVSEVIGYVLIFSLIVTTVGSIFVFGVDNLEEVQQGERVDNAERAFDVLADNVEDVVQRGAPSRATEIKLADAQINNGPEFLVNVTVRPDHDQDDNYATDGEEKDTNLVSVSPIEYSAAATDETDLRYVQGAILRIQRNGAVMRHEPEMILSDDQVVIPVVQTRAQEAGVGGSTTVLVRTDLVKRDVLYRRSRAPDGSSSYDVFVNLTVSRTGPWMRYFEDVCPTTPQVTGADDDHVVCKVDDTERVYVTRSIVDYYFD